MKVDLTCRQCGVTFTAGRRDARYCSALCSSRARPTRKRPTPEQLAAWRRRRLEDPGHRERVNAQARDRSRELKAWISAYKIERGCVDCGYREHAVALDLDHMDGKTANISALKSISAVLKEIERHACVVRCANCHRVKSLLTRTWERE